VYHFTRRKQREMLEIRRNIEDETPLTVEDSKRLRSDLAKAEQSYYSELDRKDAELERLKARVNLIAETQVNTPLPPPAAAPHTGPKTRFSPDLVEMLKLIEKANGTLSESAAIQKSELSQVETEFLLGELRRLELSTRGLDRGTGKYVYKFTHAGRAALLRDRQPEPTADEA